MQTDVIYTDFINAFNSVNHSLLKYKLNLIGFPYKPFLWISSYLNNRFQRVFYKFSVSKSIFVITDVSQVSHLGPKLFNHFIVDLPSTLLFSNIYMYADDEELYLSYNEPAL